MKHRLLIVLFLLISLRGYSQSCTLTASITSSGATICPGTTLVLTATPSGGTAPYSYIWSTGETTASISINKSGTYSVTVGDNTPGCQPVVASTTITGGTSPAAPTVASVKVCQNSPATLTATAPGGSYLWYSTATGGTSIASGATYTTGNISNFTVFYVETTVDGCTSSRSPAYVSVIGDPILKGDTVCEGNPATLIATNADSYAWYSTPNGTVLSTNPSYTTNPLTSTTTFYVVTVTSGCTSPPLPVVATVTPPPQTPTSSNLSVCSGSPANLQASTPTGVIDWFNVPNGGTSLITSADYTTPPLTATTTYYAQTTLNGCVSARTPVTVTVNANPAAPGNQTVTTCPNSSATLVASANPTGSYEWYDAPTDGTPLSNQVNYTTPVLTQSVTYYVQNSNGSCSSPRSAVQVILSVPPTAPSVPNPLICQGTAVKLTATAPGGSYQWFDVPSGGAPLATGDSYTTPVLNSNTTFYVQTTVNGCTSSRSAVTVSVLSPETGPTASGPNSICSGNTATLTASGTSGSYDWYDSATGGKYLSSGQVYITDPLTATTTFYVQTTTVNGCSSVRTPVTVTVSPIPAAPTGSSGPAVCPFSVQTLTANGSGSISWWDQPTGGNELMTSSNTYTTPVLKTNTTFYAENTNGACPGPRTPIVAQVIPVADPQFQYHPSTICPSSPNPKPTIYTTSGGVFSASPAGLVFVSDITGEINMALSQPGDYTISYAGNGTCPLTTTAQFSITSTPSATFAYTGPFCTNGTDPLPVFPAGSSGGSFTSSPGGLVFANSSTGLISLINSNAGTYTITNTIAATGGCPGAVATASVTIDNPPTVSAGPYQTVAKGNPVQLAGSYSGASAVWSGGAGTFTNPTSRNAIYTPAASETSVVLTFTTTDASGPCGPSSAQTTITINAAVPPAPTAQSKSVCSGNTTVLSATAPGGTYEWFATATGGSPLVTGPNFTTPPLTSPTTYYVQTTVDEVTSSRTAVTVNIASQLTPPTIAVPSPICEGTPATFTASGGTGTYEWYDAAVGGNLLSNSNPYVIPALSANTSVYLQTTADGCNASRVQANVVVNPFPNITSANANNVCSGDPENYTITADIPTATFVWSRAAVAGISNPAVSGQTSATINETLVNTSTAPVNVTYAITPMTNGCAGPVFNYVVTVYQVLAVTSAATNTVCSGEPNNYAITFNDPTTTFTWSRAAVAGISNTPVSGQNAGTIQEVLYNTTNAPVNATYVINYNNSHCDGVPFNLLVTVNPTATITSASTGSVCSGVAQSYIITSSVPTTTYSWSRAAVTGISNTAVAGQTTNTIAETLVNTTANPVKVTYLITPTAYSCPQPAFKYTVTVNPEPVVPTGTTSNSPVCLNTTIQLTTSYVFNATYLWTGPNGYTSTDQNPVIDNATAAATGTYYVYDIVSTCSSPPDSVAVVVDQPPVANAGPNQPACIEVTSVQLAGSISGGTTTGIWTTAGTGTFSPSSAQLNAQYTPSALDRTKGSVVLTLASTSPDNCTISTSTMTITFTKVPGADAGPDQNVCEQSATATLNGKILTTGGGTWSTSGSGNFLPSASTLNATYVASAADIAKDSVTLILTANTPGVCYLPTDSMVVRFLPPPIVNAGGTKYVLKGNTLVLTPTVSESNVHYLWSPDVDIDNDTLKNPTITGDVDRTYTLTVTDSLGCVSSDQTTIVIPPQLMVPNTFTPNGDGINDLWDIQGLIAYYSATVDIFNRYGTKIFHSVGYPKAWDGTYSGSPVPAGVYYYIIDTKVNGMIISGYVTVIR